MKKEITIPKIYGLIGYPLSNSLSPAMQNAAFKKCKINAAYFLFEKSETAFAQAVKQLKLMQVAGFNVTVPYKEKIIPYLDTLDPQAKKIGAVNTVLNQKGRFIGYNTDAPGFIQSLKSELRFEPKGKNIFILGAGGAARAIGFALAGEKARSLAFYDIYKERSEKLASDIAKHFPVCPVTVVSSMGGYSLSAIDLLVNASSSGMKKNDPLPISPSVLPKTVVVYDIIYNPSPTRLIKAARAKGIRGNNGLGMLLHQGRLAFEIWTHTKAPLVVMRRALIKALYGKSH